MFSIKGKYKDNKLYLDETLNVQSKANVILTFLDVKNKVQMMSLKSEDETKLESDGEDRSEEYYEKLRKHKRYPAQGSISLIIDDKEVSFQLRDYSAGGLSFVANHAFESGKILTASLKDPIEKDISVLDFEFEVARVIEFNDQYIVGCKFFDDVDEELWHSLIA